MIPPFDIILFIEDLRLANTCGIRPGRQIRRDMFVAQPTTFDSVSVNLEVHEAKSTKSKRILKMALITGAAILLLMIIVIPSICFILHRDDSSAKTLEGWTVPAPIMESNGAVPITEDKLSSLPFHFLIRMANANPRRSIGLLIGFVVVIAAAISLGVIFSRPNSLLTDQTDMNSVNEGKPDQQVIDNVTEDSTLSPQSIVSLIGGVLFFVLIVAFAIFMATTKSVAEASA